MESSMPISLLLPKADLAMVHVTALQSLTCKAETIVFVGRGNVLEVQNAANGQPYCYHRIFESQAIHGITVLGNCDDVDRPLYNLLIYGGHYMAWVVLTFENSSLVVPSASLKVIHSTRCKDWIICVRPSKYGHHSAAMLTSSNALYHAVARRQNSRLEISILCATLSTFLYTADILQIEPWNFLIASGTAFGEILTWCCKSDDHGENWQAYPWREYHGHSGSIFGLSISPVVQIQGQERRIVASCSDDRTIRIWDVSDVSDQASAVEGGPGQATFTPSDECLATTWAHLSRIWSIGFVDVAPVGSDFLLLSTGEDGQAQSWVLPSHGLFSSEFTPAKLFKNAYTDRHHIGKNIWSRCHYDSDKLVSMLTGGGDGQIILRKYGHNGQANLGSHRITKPFKTIRYSSYDRFKLGSCLGQSSIVLKSYLIASPDQVLATTTSGLLLQGNVSDGMMIWHTVARSDTSQPLILASAMSTDHAFFVDQNQATLCLFHLRDSRRAQVCKLRSLKISNMEVAWSDPTTEDGMLKCAIAICYFGGNEIDVVWIEDNPAGLNHSITSVSLPATFEATSTCYDSQASVLMCGSRAGAIVSYHNVSSSTAYTKPSVCVRRIHGEETVTSIAKLAGTNTRPKTECFFITTGRDGTYCVLQLNTSEVSGLPYNNSLVVLHQATPSLGPNIEGGCLVSQPDGTYNLLLYGFRSTEFIVWNETSQTQVMAVDCGGAHRDWNFRIDETTGEGGTLVWTKAGTFMLYQQTKPDHKIIQRGGHGREIKALAVHNIDSSRSLIATGSEDTDVRLFEYTTSSVGRGHLKHVAVIRRHTTGLQDLHFSPSGETLISAAGMEEMYAWKLSAIPVLGQGVVFKAALPRTDSQSDARIMNFDIRPINDQISSTSLIIAAVFSNGKAKLIQYDDYPHDTAIAKFTVLHQIDFGTICLTQAHLLPDSSHVRRGALIGATNGTVSHQAFNEARTTTTTDSQRTTASIPARPTSSHKVHQNSITAMQVTELTDNYNLIVTGGDDNALSLTIAHTLALPTTNPADLQRDTTFFRTLTIPKAHAAALTALAIIERATTDATVANPNKQLVILTAGNDQRIMAWSVSVDLTRLPPGADATSAPSQKSNQMQELQIELLAEQYTNVADVSEIAVLRNVSQGAQRGMARVKLLVVGVGMEVLEVHLRD